MPKTSRKASAARTPLPVHTLEPSPTIEREMFHFPEEILLFKNLEELKLAHTHIRSLPREIGQLTKLRRLEINGEGLTEIPDEIGQLTALEYLSLEANCICRLPDSLAGCRSLKEVNLTNNPYSYVAKAWGGWTKVKLMLEFPEVLTELPALERFNVTQTFIKSLPSKPFKSASLERLTLKGTLIAGASSPLHPTLTVDVESSKQRALNYLEYWLGRWDDAHDAILESRSEDAAAIFDLLLAINIPISEPYDAALTKLREQMDDSLKHTAKKLVPPFLEALGRVLARWQESHAGNALVVGLSRYCQELAQR